MEKIEISNFSGIKNLSAEVRRFNVLIGEQATGKSILAKLLYYYKSFPLSIYLAVENEEDKRSLDRSFLIKFSEYFPEITWGKSTFKITYQIENEYISVERLSGKRPKLSYSDFYKQHFNRLRAQYNTLQKKINEDADEDARSVRGRDRWDNLRKLRNFHLKAFEENVGPAAVGNQLFIPAGRSFFANLENNIFSFLSNNNQLDPFLRSFGSYYESIKDFRDNNIAYARRAVKADVRSAVADYTRKIIRGEYHREKRKDYIVTNDGRRVPLATSSSGQQETLPLLLILSEIAERNLGRMNQSIYIEEPEAHLFPRAQKEITEFIALAHTLNSSLQIFITTHSPYILTCLNNIIQRATHAKNENLEPRIEISDVSAYALSRDGATSLIDSDLGLIDATIIDAVSDELAREFESMI